MNIVPIALPTPREPECSMNHTKPSWSRQTSMKWLPVPRVPRCLRLLVFFKRGCSSHKASNSGASCDQAASTASGGFSHEPVSRPCRLGTEPCGTARSIALRSGPRLSGRSSARKVVLQAIIPQPMSTPTAAGMMALKVGITEPTVAPMPRCTSGIAATCLKTIGKRAALANCAMASGSTGTPRVHILMGTPPSTVSVL